MAVSWLWVFTQTWRVVYLPSVSYAVLFLAVWAIYIFDRLFDAAMRTGTPERMEERHHFHLRHKRIFAIGGVVIALLALVLTLATQPMKIFSYGLFAGLLVFCFFALSIFTNPKVGEIPIAKNAIAGLCFAYGTAVAADVQISLGGFFGVAFLDLLIRREVLCFSVLCIVNITAVDLWARVSGKDRETRADADMVITLPLALLGAASVVFAVQDHETTTRSFFYAVLTASALLYILNRIRHRFSASALRVLVDVALLVPVLVFFIFHLRT